MIKLKDYKKKLVKQCKDFEETDGCDGFEPGEVLSIVIALEQVAWALNQYKKNPKDAVKNGIAKITLTEIEKKLVKFG